jgi:hypothetical protein
MTTEKIISEIEILLVQLRESLKLSLDKNYGDSKNKIIKKKDRQLSGLSGKINELAEDGFFESPKSISEIQKKLQDEGVKKPTTSLMPPLLLLIRKKVLGREKPEKGVYKYYQR